SSQVLGIVPSDLPANTSQQLLIQRDTNLGIPTPILVSTAHPAVLTKDGSGLGQAVAYKSNGTAATTLADSSNPVKPGDTIIIYCTGLGSTDANGNSATAPTLSIGGQSAAVSYAGLALTKNYPAGGAPALLGGLAPGGLGGIYQITATVPSGAVNGAAS